MKKMICSVLILTVILSLSAMGGPALALSDEIDPVTLMVYTPKGADSPEAAVLKKFAELTKEASEGLITLDIHHSGELGDSAAALSSTQSGNIDIIYTDTFSFVYTYERVKMLNLPFLFSSGEQACEIANSDLGERLFSCLSEQGMVFLAEGDLCMRQLASTKPVKTAEDTTGLVINVPDYSLCKDTWNTLTAVPTVVAAADVPSAIADGSLQATDGAAWQILDSDSYKGITDLSVINYMWMGNTMAINAQTWNSLPLEAQQILKEQAVAAAETSISAMEDAEKDALETLESKGIEVNTEPNTNSFLQALGGKEYYARYADSGWFDQELLDAILAEVR